MESGDWVEHQVGAARLFVRLPARYAGVVESCCAECATWTAEEQVVYISRQADGAVGFALDVEEGARIEPVELGFGIVLGQPVTITRLRVPAATGELFSAIVDARMADGSMIMAAMLSARSESWEEFISMMASLAWRD